MGKLSFIARFIKYYISSKSISSSDELSFSLTFSVRMTKNGILCANDKTRVNLDPKKSDFNGVNFVSHAHIDHLPSK